MSSEPEAPVTEEPTSWREVFTAAGDALQRASARTSRWMEEHQEGIGLLLEGLSVIRAVQPKLEELWRRWGDSEWGYLVWRLDFLNGFALMLLLDEGADEGMLDFLEPPLSEAEFIEGVQSKVVEAPLSDTQKHQLQAGLDFVGRRDHEVAVPLLIIALEGAMFAEAEKRNLVERAAEKMRFTETSGRRGTVGSVEGIFEPLGLNEHLDAFLRRQVYGGRGNRFRHGTALDGWRQKSLTLTIALVAWLDLMLDEDDSLLVEAFGRQDQALDIAAEQITRQRAATRSS